MGQYFSIYGTMKFIPHDKATHLRVLLDASSLKPLDDLLSWDEGKGGSRVMLQINDDTSFDLDITGTFNKLGWHLTDHIDSIIDAGYEAYGSYSIHSDDGENWFSLSKGEGSIVYEIYPEAIEPEEALSMLRAYQFGDSDLEVTGSIELTDEALDSMDYDKILERYEKIADFIDQDIIYVCDDYSDPEDIELLIQLIKNNKEDIECCLISAFNDDLYLSYELHNSNGSFMGLDLESCS